MTRRQWLSMGVVAPVALRSFARPQQGATVQQTTGKDVLPLKDFQPKSMLHVTETHVQRSKFPVIDFHTHITSTNRSNPSTVRFNMKAEACLPVMDRKNIRTMVDLTGGYGQGVRDAVAGLQTAHPGRFLVFTEPAYTRASEPGYAKLQADMIEDAYKSGARGLKVLKTLGLFLKQKGTNEFVHVDDKRFDPMWEAAGSLGMPVAIHTSEPEAFFTPVDRFNERWEELHTHPDSAFFGKGTPTNLELQEARRNVMRRHPKTQFVCLHVADSENLAYTSECLDSHPNMSVDIAARIAELGRQPRAASKFFDKYQDRIVFGTDASAGTGSPQQIFEDELYEIYYRFLETEDENFDYAPWPTPPQGRWRISGVGLSEKVLKKVYEDNAVRLIGLST